MQMGKRNKTSSKKKTAEETSTDDNAENGGDHEVEKDDRMEDPSGGMGRLSKKPSKAVSLPGGVAIPATAAGAMSAAAAAALAILIEYNGGKFPDLRDMLDIISQSKDERPWDSMLGYKEGTVHKIRRKIGLARNATVQERLDAAPRLWENFKSGLTNPIITTFVNNPGMAALAKR